MNEKRSHLQRYVLPLFAGFLFATLLPIQSDGIVENAAPQRMGQVVDWSSRHVLYPLGASLRALAISQRDPRAYWNYLRLVQAGNPSSAPIEPAIPVRPRPIPRIHGDWSVPLGAAGTGTTTHYMFPAKFSFNVNATPSCTNDYVVFPINVAPSATQANIAAFNNLYTGTTSTSCTATVSIAASPTGAVENAARTTATITTTTPHGLSVGESVVISGVANTTFNGTFAVVTTPTTTTFTVANAAPAASATSGGGTAAISTAPTVDWAYAVSTVALPTSPIISLDGTKVAFVDAANPAVFHVLTPTPGQGTVTAPATPTTATIEASPAGAVENAAGTTATITTTAANGLSVGENVTIYGVTNALFNGTFTVASVSGNAFTVANTAPAANATSGGGTVGNILNLTLGTTGDTNGNSPPFMDYYKDIAYVGNDAGVIYTITPVFGTAGTPTASTFATITGTPALTGPVKDFGTGNIFVGGANGDLYGFSSANTPITDSPLAIGNGSTDSRAVGTIADPPIVDVVNGLLYTATGANGTDAVAVQASTSSFASPVTTVIGYNNEVLIHAGAFNANYFSSSTSTTWFFYVCGVDTTPGGHYQKLQQIGFTVVSGKRVMNTTTTASADLQTTTEREPCSPLTEFENAGVDYLFLGLPTSATTGLAEYFNITSPFAAGATASVTATEAGGTSGIIVDNVSTTAQASSIYFTTQSTTGSVCGTGKFCAVKLTQAALQ